MRNSDVNHPYRPDSNMLYLVGIEEPKSLFVMTNSRRCLFVQTRGPVQELWQGPLYGVKGALKNFKPDECFDIKELPHQLSRILKDKTHIYYTPTRDTALHSAVAKALPPSQEAHSTQDAGDLLRPMRLVKDSHEQELLDKACRISTMAHTALMQYVRPGMNERELHGKLIYEFMRHGAAREAYGSIVASGANACVLHYTQNNQILQEDQMLLVDAGAEYQYYAGDITRCYPVGKCFSSVHRHLYERVLSVQGQILNHVAPGMCFEKLQSLTARLLSELMIEEKLLTTSLDEAIEQELYKKYYPHGVGHWLGLDVHDVSLPSKKQTPAQKKTNLRGDKSTPFAPGMCLTVEPGLYIPLQDESAPANMRGIGIRIEDDLLITKQGAHNLTHDCPKAPQEIENLRAKAFC